MKLDGVAAIVTGGGSGLGRATAEALAARGAKVAVFDLNSKAAEEAAKAIGGLALAGDVADEASAGAAVAKAAAAHGPARVLVNCAGIGTPKRVVGREGPQPLADFEKVIRVNLIGTFNMIRLAAAEMAKLEPIDGERGVVISTASIAAFDGQIGQAAYSASKGGVVAMTLPIARELAQFGVRVNTIAPGIFMTPMLFGLPQAGAGFARRLGAVPRPPRPPGRICRARPPHHRERLYQRRDDPHRRRAAHGAEIAAVRRQSQPEGDCPARKCKKIQGKSLASLWIPLADSGLFNGLRRIQIKKSACGVARASGCIGTSQSQSLSVLFRLGRSGVGSFGQRKNE